MKCQDQLKFGRRLMIKISKTNLLLKLLSQPIGMFLKKYIMKFTCFLTQFLFYFFHRRTFLFGLIIDNHYIHIKL